MQVWRKTNYAKNINSKCLLCGKTINSNNEQVEEWGMVIDWLGKSDEHHVCGSSHQPEDMDHTSYEELIWSNVAEKEKLCRIYFTLSNVIESPETDFSKIKLKC